MNKIFKGNCVGGVLKFRTPKGLTKWHMQTMPTQIRLLLIRVYIVCHSTKYFKKQLHKKQILSLKSIKYSGKNFRAYTIIWAVPSE